MFIITGQTATGKTAAALKLAHLHNGELISADSRQVYRGLDIITGKDKNEVDVPLHGVDLIDPTQRYSSHEFVEYSTKTIQNIQERGKTPIVVGGTYLYIKHLLYGFDVHVAPNEPLRKKLENKSVDELQVLLADLGQKAKNIKPKIKDLNDSDIMNPRRLVRRIELLTHYIDNPNDGKTLQTHEPLVRCNKTTITGYRYENNDLLKKAIEARVVKRLEQGAVEEVEDLLSHGFKSDDPGMLTIGSAQIIKLLKGEYSKDQMQREWTTQEVQYAKRQYTFMKTDPAILWQVV